MKEEDKVMPGCQPLIKAPRYSLEVWGENHSVSVWSWKWPVTDKKRVLVQTLACRRRGRRPAESGARA